jgi:hypothetical protein
MGWDSACYEASRFSKGEAIAPSKSFRHVGSFTDIDPWLRNA